MDARIFEGKGKAGLGGVLEVAERVGINLGTNKLWKARVTDLGEVSSRRRKMKTLTCHYPQQTPPDVWL